MSGRERTNDELKAIFAQINKKGISSSDLETNGIPVSFSDVPESNRMLVEVPDDFNSAYDVAEKRNVKFEGGVGRLVKLKNDRIAIKGTSSISGNKVLRIIG